MKIPFFNRSKNVGFFGTLTPKEREEKYFKYERNKSANFIRTSIFFIGLAFFLIVIFDYGYNNHADFIRSFMVRSMVLLFSTFLFFTLNRVRTSKFYYGILTLFPLVLSLAFIYILARQGAQGLAYQCIAIILIIFSITILPVPWPNALVINSVISVFFITFSTTYIKNEIFTNYVEICIYLTIATFFTAMVKKKDNTSRRENYLWERQLRIQSTVDTLTGCYNRLWIDNKMEEFSLFRDSDPNSHFSLIMLDIDNFKKVNDVHGHLVGDKVLIECASLVRSYIRPSDYYARWGGEEFVILLPLKTLEEGYQVAERIRQGIEGHDFGVTWGITCSFGVAASRPRESAEDLVRRVDNMLYLAKRNGKNRVEKDTSVPALLTAGSEIA